MKKTEVSKPTFYATFSLSIKNSHSAAIHLCINDPALSDKIILALKYYAFIAAKLTIFISSFLFLTTCQIILVFHRIATTNDNSIINKISDSSWKNNKGSDEKIASLGPNHLHFTSLKANRHQGISGVFDLAGA